MLLWFGFNLQSLTGQSFGEILDVSPAGVVGSDWTQWRARIRLFHATADELLRELEAARKGERTVYLGTSKHAIFGHYLARDVNLTPEDTGAEDAPYGLVFSLTAEARRIEMPGSPGSPSVSPGGPGL